MSGKERMLLILEALELLLMSWPHENKITIYAMNQWQFFMIAWERDEGFTAHASSVFEDDIKNKQYFLHVRWLTRVPCSQS